MEIMATAEIVTTTNVMTTTDLMNMILPLVGVLIGGLITYFVQKKAIKEAHDFEREKIREENLQKDKEIKFQTYNKILYSNGSYIFSEWSLNGNMLNKQNYLKFIRPVLFEIYHLLDKEILVEFNKIEEIYSRQSEKGDLETDKKNLHDSYIKIIETIKRKYKEHQKLQEITVDNN